MKIEYKYLLFVFVFPFTFLFDKFMYPFFKTQGITYLEIGVIDAVFSIASLVFLYYFGHISDRIGRRKALAGFLIYYAPFPLIYLKVSNFLQGCLARIAQTPSFPTFPTETAYEQDLAHLIPKNRKATFFGILSTVGGIGGFLCPIIGGFLIDKYGFQFLGLIAFLVILLVVLLILVLPEPSKIKKNKKIVNKINFKILKGNKFLEAFSIYYFLTGISLVIAFIWIPFLSLQSTKSYEIVGFIMSATSFFMIFGRIPFGYLADRYGRNKTFIIAGVLSPISLLLLAISNSVLALILSSLLASLASSIMLPAQGAILSCSIEPSIRGGVFNALDFLSRCGVIIGGLIGGIIATFVGIPYAFMFAALTESLAILMFIYIVRK